jgi:hypothetical protein
MTNTRELELVTPDWIGVSDRARLHSAQPGFKPSQLLKKLSI